MCKESFEDDPDVTEDEIAEELAIIRVQQGYLLQRQGRNNEANTIYNQVQRHR